MYTKPNSNILGVFIILGVVGLSGFLILYRPNISAIEITVNVAQPLSPGWFGTPSTQTVGASFDLVNTGLADGIVTVKMSGGGHVWYQEYFVPAHTTVHKDMRASVAWWESFDVDVWIVGVKGPFF